MTILYVTYTGNAETRFDRQYYVARHLPLVMQAWGPHGLETCVAFFPGGTAAGTIAIAECRFRDEASLQAAFGSSESAHVMADINNFTNVEPSRSRVVPL
jgi:uncharacterized protein (TIGR02118 family)